jgi:hypothetical protein
LSDLVWDSDKSRTYSKTRRELNPSNPF